MCPDQCNETLANTSWTAGHPLVAGIMDETVSFGVGWSRHVR